MAFASAAADSGNNWTCQALLAAATVGIAPAVQLAVLVVVVVVVAAAVSFGSGLL